jgi:hypothetical protein
VKTGNLWWSRSGRSRQGGENHLSATPLLLLEATPCHARPRPIAGDWCWCAKMQVPTERGGGDNDGIYGLAHSSMFVVVASGGFWCGRDGIVWCTLSVSPGV